MNPRIPALLVAGALFTAPLAARSQEHADHMAMSDSADVAAVVTAFHAALAAQDGPGALAMLDPEARILEGGSIETAEDYAAGHLTADMAFAAAVPRERGPMEVRVVGEVAWAASTSRTKGTYRGREIDSRGAELVVLKRSGEGWRIVAIQWSSR